MPTDEPPRGLRVAFVAAVVAALFFTAVSLLRATGDWPGLLLVAPPVGLMLAFSIWARVTKRVVESVGGTVAVAANPVMTCGWVLFLLFYALPISAPTVFLGRALAGLLLVVGFVIGDRKTRRWYAQPADPAAGPGVPPASTPSASSPPGSFPPDSDPRGSVPRGSIPPQVFPPRSFPSVDFPPAAQPEDWDAARWDPEIQEDIERRRHRGRRPD